MPIIIHGVSGHRGFTTMTYNIYPFQGEAESTSCRGAREGGGVPGVLREYSRLECGLDNSYMELKYGGKI